jgi:Bacterial membrane protein YfhO
MGVRWFITAGLPEREIKVMAAKGFRIVERAAYFLVWERPAPPLARMYYDLDVIADPAQRVARLHDNYPLLQRAIVEKPLGPLSQPRTPAAVELRKRAQTRVEVEVQGAADGLLVLADPWYPQWKVTVDGRPAELLRVDHAFRGVRVPAGSHRVVFTYEDRALQVGLVVSAVSVLGLAGLWLWRRRRRPDHAQAAEPAEL